MSDLIEHAPSRELVQTLLAGQGFPQFVLRCGTKPIGAPLGNAPRRIAATVIDDARTRGIC
jgi:hypothetical protein